MDLEPLRRWFEEEKRDFPWRRENTAYRVWISEVMLQQTKASVVIPYFKRWMELFPTVHALAEAPLELVMKAWEGLGYYSRARNLHEVARVIVTDFGGIFPSDREKLAALKGIGPYTVGAILSFAFHKRAPAVDGNVVRVISRLLALQEDGSRKELYEQAVEKLLPFHEPWVIMEALIELGALVCQKKPSCISCPMQEQCLAYHQGIEETLPVMKKRSESIAIHRNVAIILYNDFVLVRQEAVGKVMGGLYEFPYVEKGQVWDLTVDMQKEKELPVVKHTFTKYRATLYPVVWKVKEKKDIMGYHWVSIARLASIPFSSGHRKICNEYFTHGKLE
jgi:A/G-specific adenine glycosylase